jgi:hypothetical protein
MEEGLGFWPRPRLLLGSAGALPAGEPGVHGWGAAVLHNSMCMWLLRTFCQRRPRCQRHPRMQLDRTCCRGQGPTCIVVVRWAQKGTTRKHCTDSTQLARPLSDSSAHAYAPARQATGNPGRKYMPRSARPARPARPASHARSTQPHETPAGRPAAANAWQRHAWRPNWITKNMGKYKPH